MVGLLRRPGYHCLLVLLLPWYVQLMRRITQLCLVQDSLCEEVE